MAHAMPQVKGVDHRFLRVGGDMSFHVALAGRGRGNPVLLLHGWPQHWYAWRLVIPRLARHHRVIAMDLRGFGWSDIAWTDFEKERMAEDAIRVLDALEIERVRVVGHGWGGWIGYLLALNHPERVERLVTLAAAPPWLRPTPRNLASLLRFHYMLPLSAPYLGPKLSSRRVYVTRKLKRWSRQRAALDRETRRLYYRDIKASTRARAAALLHRTFVARELLPVLRGRYRSARLEVPALAIYGGRDPLVAPRLFRGHEGRGGAEFRTLGIPKTGHFLPEERPERVANAILDFFGSREAAEGAGETGEAGEAGTPPEPAERASERA